MLLFLFFTICYSVYHLSEIIPTEVNELVKQHTLYNNLIDESINRIIEVIESGDFKKLTAFDKSDIEDRLASLKTEQKIDRSLTIIRSLLLVALSLLFISFIPLSTAMYKYIPVITIKMTGVFHIFGFTFDVPNAILGGIIGLGLVMLVDYFRKPKVAFKGFISEQTSFGLLYKAVIEIKGSTNPGLTQVSITYGEKEVNAKWDEKPNPLEKDNLDFFKPELVPDTQYFNTFSNKIYKIPIIHKDSEGNVSIFCGWWFGRKRGYGPSLDIDKSTKIKLGFISQNVSANSKLYSAEEIEKEALKKD